MTKSNQIIDCIFNEAESLKKLAKDAVFTRKICKEHPGGMGGPIMGDYPRITSKTTKAALWGGGENLTLSLLKTDVIDRRYVDKDHFTMKDLIEAAYSEKNKDLNDMPLAGMTRPPFAVQHMKNGMVTVSLEKDQQKMEVRYLMSMVKNVTAMEVDYEKLEGPLAFRLYRNLDQEHRCYENEDGTYKKFVVYTPADGDVLVEYYDFEADKDINGHFEPPTCDQEGRFFWIHQVFPAEKTFPEGFRYVMMSLVSGEDAELVCYDLAQNLGSAPHIPRDGQGVLKVPGIRTTTHSEIFEMMAQNYSYVAAAPGVVAEAKLGEKGSRKIRIYMAIVTVNETEDYMERAKELLLEAEKQGFEGLAVENQNWYDAFVISMSPRDSDRSF
ncbi:MAG: hypothetical protein HDR71_18160 [Lachnospiraceae bacterium]|nr:hypothetical protein [Lachnospiraceae bacterium]